MEMKYRSAYTWGPMTLLAAMLGLGDASANERTTTHCVGRFLIDLPAEAEYISGNYEYAFAKVEPQPMERNIFLKEVDDIEARLRKDVHKSGTSLLLTKVAPSEDAQIFGYWGNENRSSAVEISGYRGLHGVRYVVHKRANYDKVERAVSRMENTISMLQPRDSNSPTTPGFCVGHAIFADEGRTDNESLNIRFRFSKHLDIIIDVATNFNAGDPPESLLSRRPGTFSALGVLGATLGGIRNIRVGDRTISDHPGQEWLMKAPNEHGQKAHLFSWEAPGLHRDALHPQIRIDLQSGNFDGGLDPKPISMTDEQMLELWDRILNSLRLRPTAAAPSQ